jgi:hypothetical protein
MPYKLTNIGLHVARKIHDQFRNHSGQFNSVLKALKSTIEPGLKFGFGTVAHPNIAWQTRLGENN